MATKSGQRGRYITKVGFYDIYAKDTLKKGQLRGKHAKPQVESTVYNIYHAKKLVESGFKTKDLAIEKVKELLGETFREVYSL
jgi:hypothetical protein